MPFDAADPRAALSPDADVTAGPRGGTGFAATQLIDFAQHPAARSGAGSRSWTVRAQNFAVVYSEAVDGEVFNRDADEFEHFVIVTDEGTSVRITTPDESGELHGPSIAVVPPGASTVHVTAAGPIVRVFTAAARDLVDASITAAHYATVPAHVAVHDPQPAPAGLRCFAVADFPPDPGRFGHIFRSQNLMMNFVPTRDGPRDVTKLSPHHHADFEQCTVQIEGSFVHHVRTPWTPDGTTWREDEHLSLDGPGMVVFPPPIVHTSQAVGGGPNRLLDVFGPPRADFLAKPGWVLNAEDYVAAQPAR